MRLRCCRLSSTKRAAPSDRAIPVMAPEAKTCTSPTLRPSRWRAASCWSRPPMMWPIAREPVAHDGDERAGERRVRLLRPGEVDRAGWGRDEHIRALGGGLPEQRPGDAGHRNRAPAEAAVQDEDPVRGGAAQHGLADEP